MTKGKGKKKLNNNSQQQNGKKMSRQPPLPPGPPPSRNHNNHPYDQIRSADVYRPGDRYDQGPPPSMYQFRGSGSDSYHPQRSGYDQRARSRSPPRNPYNYGDNDRSYRPTYNDRPPPPGPMAMNATSHRQNENFNFRFDAPPGVDYRAADNYRTAPRSPPRGRASDRHQNNDNNQRRNTRGNYRGRAGPRLASDRAFLKTNRDPTPELMPGMDEDVGNGVRYKAVEDLSDSEEEEMDISDSDNEDDADHPRKQARTEAKAADGDSVPRWSNPDPYTALPPPDESQRKKKDVVKLIRKARVAAETDANAKTEAATDDFISFDFDDDQEEEAGEQSGLGVEGAPTGPRSSKSHGASMQEHFGNPNTDLQLRERPSNSNIPSTSTIPAKPTTNDIGSTLRTKGSIPSQHNLPPRPGPSSGSGMPSSVPATNNAKQAPMDLRSDPVFGSRKRNIDDEIKAPPRLHGKNFGKKKPAASGSVVPDWRPKDHEHPTPWISMDHSDSAKMGIWLHKEIMDFYHYVKPRDFEQFIRVKLVENLRAEVQSYISHNADVLAFGSFPAGLYLPTADMDLVCVSSSFMRGGRAVFGGKKSLFQFKEFLCRRGLALDNKVECISSAKVPLCKYVDKLTGLKVDVSFENETGLIANKTFQEWKVQFPAMPIIVSFVKHLLAMRGLNEPVNGGIGGFSVICLVVSLLQNMPQVQSGNMVPEHNLGEILMEFFDLYGNHFNMETTAISLKPAGYVSKAHANVPYNQHNTNKFCIIDPNRPENDISGGAKNSAAIRSLFSEGFQTLQNRMAELQYSAEADRRCQSILGPIIAGNYSSFRLQREHLAHMYERQVGPVDLTAH